MLKFWHVGLRSIKSSSCNRINLKSWKRIRCFSNTSESITSKTFEEALNDRRQQAKRSIVVQVNSEKSYPELWNYCSQFGTIEGAHHYKIPHEELHFILIEFENESTAAEVINSSCYNEDLTGVPVRSPFLWFRAGKKKSNLSTASSKEQKRLAITDGTRAISSTECNDLLTSANNLEDQIKILHRSTCLNDIGVRLRFLSARQIETSISGMFPYANAIPFGSSVNGFGKMGCDLDLVLRLDVEQRNINKESRLVYHTKETLSNGRSQAQRYMESISDMLQLFLPGVCHVRRILQARVPIIKFHHEHLDLEVDLSMSNLTGVYMSELFYMFGQLDSRVRPLTFTIRRWAHTVGLTNPSPGRWISNFSLTCLVIFFLQQLKTPILPPINLFIKSAKPSDLRITEDGINCTFLRDQRELKFESKNKLTMSELLLQFFEFYSQFDFNNRAISLNEGRSILKPEHSAMYIVNPLEQVLNVSKNVSLEECERFRIEVRNAAWMLESEMDRNNATQTDGTDTPWGLLNLFRSPEKSVIKPNMFFKPRMVDVSELFEGNVEYKNNSIRNQVQNIKAKGKSDLKQLRASAISEKHTGRRR